MNVRESENGGYETQVAIPTNRLLKNDGKILFPQNGTRIFYSF